MPYKTFADGEILLAAEVNEHLMRQTIIHIPGATEQAAIPAPTPGMRVYREDRHDFETYDGIVWVPDDTGWTNLTLAGGATTVDGLTPRIRRRLGVVYLSGRVNQASSSIATIPVGYRPDRDFRTAVTAGSSGTSASVLIAISSTGALSTSAGQTVNLDGVCWVL